MHSVTNRSRNLVGHRSARDPNTSARDPNTSARDPNTSARDPNTSARDPNTRSRAYITSLPVAAQTSIVEYCDNPMRINLSVIQGLFQSTDAEGKKTPIGNMYDQAQAACYAMLLDKLFPGLFPLNPGSLITLQEIVETLRTQTEQELNTALFRLYFDDAIWNNPKLITINPSSHLDILKQITRCLLKAGADITERAPNKSTLLFLAIKANRIDIVQILIDAGADINATECNFNDIWRRLGATALHYAAEYGCAEIVQALIAKRTTDINARDGFGKNAIDYAEQNGNLDIAELLRAAADINAQYIERTSEFQDAVANKNIPAILRLIGEGININYRNYSDETFLHRAVRRGRPHVVQAVLQGRPNINAKDHEGNTPLHVAARFHRIEVVKILLAAGADTTEKNKEGNTPLQVAEQRPCRIYAGDIYADRDYSIIVEILQKFQEIT